MYIFEDTRNKIDKHEAKNGWFKQHGIDVVRTKLYVGDYTLPTNQSVCIDTKKDIQELVGDLCNSDKHREFVNECKRAREVGIQLIVLVENEEIQITPKIQSPFIKSVYDLHSWINPRLFKGQKKATKGRELQKICLTMQERYGVVFYFCRPENSAVSICKILGIEV